MGRRIAHQWEHRPDLLVYGIRNIGDVWGKLTWDIVQFETLLCETPVDIVSVPYAYPNICVTAVALRDWFVTEVRLRATRANQPWDDATAYELVRSRVRWSRLAEDVANTFKHRGYRSEGLNNGIVDLRLWLPTDLQRKYEKIEDAVERAFFAIRHGDVARWSVLFRDTETGFEVNALEMFTAWEKDWHSLLSDLDMLDEN